jgi:hypothetical protein
MLGGHRDKARALFFRLTEGFKAFGLSAFLAALWLADYFDAVNIAPLLAPIVGADRAHDILLYAPIIIASLRFVAANNPRFKRDSAPADGSPF